MLRGAMDFEAVTDPLQVVVGWKNDAHAQGAPLADAMTLCTIAHDGSPRSRVVLWKAVVGECVHFFTNYESDKARELLAEPRASVVMFFPSLGRQARVRGRAEKLTAAQSDAYFATRPRLSQLGAWASDQSRPMENRDELARRVQEFETIYAGGDVPRPPHWGGFGLRAAEVELWVAHEGRLHERAVYRFNQAWSAPVRLFP